MRIGRPIVSVSLILLFGGAMFLLLGSHREPAYNGKPLGYWLDQYQLSSAPSSIQFTNRLVRRNEARDAIGHIGTNGIHVLLRRLEQTDSPLKRKVVALLPARWAERCGIGPSSRPDLYVPLNYPQEALDGFEILGPSAKDAAPGLVRVLRSGRNRDGRRAAIGSLGCVGPAAAPALPEIVCDFKDPVDRPDAVAMDPVVRAVFAIACDNGKWRPECVRVLVPALIDLLKDPHADTWRVIHMLDFIGPDACSAIPAIQPFVNSTDPKIRSIAVHTVKCIAPDAPAFTGKQ